ncbi:MULTISPECIES: rhamnulokinase [unclassified Roseburia]|uniref:rhamnulokinase n=1 Tax=unclassified Roseburia TaxID=2637578 RepID=UPI000E4B8FDB|nr:MULTISPECIES: rhamnulokinase [unclassified Roseburia]RGF58415.1 rhamnulokinase [Roseburia sp. AF34-16]RGG39439.1 rhamnulokinase [Roseburia sp. AF22-8AC]RGG43185.1 rhamnulokinase [Roseburia sp. AF22-2LB]RHQ42374.1 rhamnulokinase [Roseburia sp. AF25-18LB]RHQ44004.1 rhamnulokinase [Roseburia sp. AF25-25LB]
MNTKYYLAVDIGASSGRHMLAHLEDGKIVLEEIYRFSNEMIDRKGYKVWNVRRLFQEILSGMKKCAELGKIPYSMGIDTWAVDYVLLDENDRRIGETVAYRDKRTYGMDEEVYKLITEEQLYLRTGIQKQIFNTIYQLMALKKTEPGQLERAETFLMVPDYFNFLLTGRKVQEYTNATTTQLVNPATKDWDDELLEKLGIKRNIFQEIKMAGCEVGELEQEIQKQVGFNCKVILPPTHDTASAVVAVPSRKEETLYISSGTWSLMGTERLQADCSKESMLHNFTNEGGYGYRYRFLKNIMGLWMIQSVRKELVPDMSFAEICELAEKEKITSLVDVNDERFLAPESMVEEVRSACWETLQQVPKTIGEIAAVIYNSLANCYAMAAKEIEIITGQKYQELHIVGGGANADFLNKLTAKYTGKTVLAGPTEATALGNISVQMITAGEFADLKEARECIYHSFEIKLYKA